MMLIKCGYDSSNMLSIVILIKVEYGFLSYLRDLGIRNCEDEKKPFDSEIQARSFQNCNNRERIATNRPKLTTTLFLVFWGIFSERHLDTIIDRDAVVLNSEVGCFIMSLDNAVRHLGKQIIDSSSILCRGVEDGGSDLVRVLLNVVSINSTIQVDLVTHQK